MKIKFTTLILFCLVVLTGCPVDLDYALGNSGTEKNDSKFYGTWQIDDLEEAVISFTASKKTENTLHVEVNRYGEMFSPNTTTFTGWFVSLGGMRFLCFEENANRGHYFHYVVVELTDTQLKVCSLGLLSGGKDAVKSQETLRSEVLASMKKPEFTSEPILYKKIK